MSRTALWISALAMLLGLGLAGWYGYERYLKPRPAPVAAAPAPVAAAEPASAAASEPAIRYPVEPPASTAGVASLEEAAAALLGRADAQRFLRLDEAARRFVATVDNLAREQAPARLWPVQPTPGRFAPDTRGERSVLSAANARRYAPFVAMVSALDSARAVGLYRQFYPQLQQAYEAQGYPGRYFNDRVVAVIDHLLQTPDPSGEVALVLTDVKGPLQPQSPWLRYEFADRSLEQRSAGQKMLLRMGPANARALKAKLGELRALLVAPASAASR